MAIGEYSKNVLVRKGSTSERYFLSEVPSVAFTAKGGLFQYPLTDRTLPQIFT